MLKFQSTVFITLSYYVWIPGGSRQRSYKIHTWIQSLRSWGSYNVCAYPLPILRTTEPYTFSHQADMHTASSPVRYLTVFMIFNVEATTSSLGKDPSCFYRAIAQSQPSLLWVLCDDVYINSISWPLIFLRSESNELPGDPKSYGEVAWDRFVIIYSSWTIIWIPKFESPDRGI